MSIALDKMVLIFLGIVVIAVALFFYFKYIRPETTSCEICRNLLASWCQKCELNKYPSNEGLPPNVCDCSIKCKLISACGSCKELKSECSIYILNIT